MKNKDLQTLGFAILSTVALTACSGLGKMVKNSSKVTYTITPNPLEMHGDSIRISVSGKYPPKFFAKKAHLKVTPTFTYEGGEKSLKPITLVGDKSPEKGTKIPYDKGGSFSYTDVVAYEKGMHKAELKVKATAGVKTKTKDFPEVAAAKGTIVTPLLVRNDEKGLLGKDNFTKVVPVSSTANIYYVINQSTVRPSELNSAEVKALRDFIALGAKSGYTFKNVNVSAYASPDGELTLNANLAEDRAQSASRASKDLFKKNKLTEGTADEFYNKVTTAEDWEGFKKLMEASSIQDKELILRVLSMYPDGEVREKEIKNLSKTYLEVAEQILPKLRRAVLTLNAEQKSRSDEEITRLANSTPDSLSIEELLYSATLTNDINAKLSIYKAAERIYPQDWRGINNVGYIYLIQNKAGDAKSQFDKANSISANNPVVQNNLGIIARWNGDRKAAAEYYKSAMSAGPEVSYNMGIIHILNGDYASATTNFGNNNTFNSALAKLLNGNLDGSISTLDASPEKDAAHSDYLKAIAHARKGNAGPMAEQLKKAIGKDASYKQKAAEDAEFLKFADNADFKAAIQ